MSAAAAAAETGGGAQGVMGDSFPNPTFQISPPIPSPNPLSHTLSFPYASAAPSEPTLSASSPPYQPPRVADGAPGDQLKRKKRGRPRKYNPDGSPATLTPTQVPINPPAGNFSQSLPPHSAPASSPTGRPASLLSSSMKKPRGRPPGSSLKQQGVEVLGPIGIGFKPHVITVQEGEDVSAKIMSFSQQGPRAICILSATGAISNVTIRQASTSGGTATFEGRFDILSLSGSFLLSEFGGQPSRTGGLSVTLAGPGGCILGGCVAGLLTAASPVQVILGSFMADGRKESKSKNHTERLSAPFKVSGGASGSSSSPSCGTLSESSGGPGSPFCQGSGACNNVNPQVISMEWN